MKVCVYLIEEPRKEYCSVTPGQRGFKAPMPSVAAPRGKLSTPREAALLNRHKYRPWAWIREAELGCRTFYRYQQVKLGVSGLYFW